MPRADTDIFVTGGAGFIGSALIRQWLDETDLSVVNIDKLTYASSLDAIPQAARNPRYRFAKVDICDGPALRQLFDNYRPRYVMNLAAETHVDRSIDGPADFIQSNVVGTFTLLQEATRYWSKLAGDAQESFRLLHISTDEVHGSLGDAGVFTEETRYAPNSPYAASKASSDHLVRAWRQTYGLPTLITNCSNNFGPFQFPEKLIPLSIIRSLTGRTLPVYGDGRHIRDWIHVDDHARALRFVLERGRVGETYNIGSRNERTNLEIVRLICRRLDEIQPLAEGRREQHITFVADRPGHDRRYAIDPSKIERELGWCSVESFESSLARTVSWYLENKSWWESCLERGYNAERLGQIRA